MESETATGIKLVAYAAQQGVDLSPFLLGGCFFQRDGRSIFLWRKLDSIPATGPIDMPEGTLCYNMQGTIAKLPSVLSNSARAFQGMWSEAGALQDLDQATRLVQAWLLDRKEIDELPVRLRRRYSL